MSPLNTRESEFRFARRKNPGLTGGQDGGTTLRARLENKLQRQLKNAGVVDRIGVEQ
jgi:hypothetical protein